MPSYWLVEMFKGDFADTCGKEFLLIRGQAEGLACADPGARAPIGDSGNLNILLVLQELVFFSGWGGGEVGLRVAPDLQAPNVSAQINGRTSNYFNSLCFLGQYFHNKYHIIVGKLVSSPSIC